jgi:predicted acylesterase/phospholipase RssA
MNSATVPPVDRYCDLVMKGGITSGIVYPPLVARLSESYRFKSIGGTSAGAIAAAATAAAEYRRRTGGVNAPFPPELGELPSRLSESVDGHSKLFSLFQAELGGCRRLFRVLTTALNAKGTWHRVFKIGVGFLLGYWLATLVSVLIALWVGTQYGMVAGTLSLLCLLLVTIGLLVYRDFTRSLVTNNYGLCTGMTAPGYRYEALTPWLHQLIQDLAGKPLDQPLTFEDLWAAPGFPPLAFNLPHGMPVRSIDLRMFTTNLSTGRPFILPFTDETCRLFFDPHELKRYLPTEVVTFMEANSIPYTPCPPSDPPAAEAARLGLDLRELPPGKWPVVLAARLSLSFPVLFCAVPLWAIDYDPARNHRTFRRCMFSDGGISSNFPIHMFDGLLPMWPTFGVQLEPKLKHRPNMVFLPPRYAEGYGERWNRFDEQKTSGNRMGGFLSAIMGAMQNWNDNTASRMPGVRDRVVRIRLDDDEGGMNLNMPADTIQKVAARGDEAAKELIARFDAPGLGWRDQRWIRFRVTLESLRARFSEVGLTLRYTDPQAGSYDDLATTAMTEIIDGETSALSPAEGAMLRDILVAMRNFDAAISGQLSSVPDFHVMPSTDLKVRPSL